MRKLAAVVLVLLLVIPMAGALGKARNERGSAPGAEVRTDNRGRTFQAAGWLTIVKPGAGDTAVELDAYVWVPVKKIKGATCFGFEIERSGASATVTVYCDPPKRGGPLMASLEVDAIVWEGNSGEGFDRCRDRHDMKKDTVYSCTLDLPEAFDNTETREHS